MTLLGSSLAVAVEQEPPDARPAGIAHASLGMRAARRAPGVREILALMLCTDALLIGAHLVASFTPYLSGQSFHLATERGFGEAFQYVKMFWVAVSFLWLGVRVAQRAYLVWPLIFGYLLIDDAFRMHERVGHSVAGHFHFSRAAGLSAQDFGEIVVFALLGAGSLLLIGIAYLCGSAAFRAVARRMSALLVLFGLVAGGMDVLHGLMDHVPLLNTLLTVLEDGGELMVMSVICAYAVGLLLERRRLNLMAP